MPLLDLAVIGAGATATVLASLRWLRVAQREGWAVFAATAWAARWWTQPANVAVAATGLLSLVIAPLLPPTALATSLGVAAGPFGLALRGRRPGPLRWTPRCRRVGAAVAAGWVIVVGSASLAGTGAGAIVAVALATLAPVLVDAAAILTGGPDPSEGTVPTGPGAEEVLDDLAAALTTTRRVLVAGGPAGAAGRALAAKAVAVASHLLIVGRNARADLQAGAAEGPAGCSVVLCHDVEHAASWVEHETSAVDTVRWLSIPPDHVP